MKVLVYGGTGLAGSHVVDLLRLRGHEVHAPRSTVAPIGHAEDRICAYRPDAVVNCAGFVNADQAERQPQDAFAVNDAGAGLVARGAYMVGARLIHVSTNFVYEDSVNEDPAAAYEANEMDLPWECKVRPPRGVYARSKHAGDLRVLKQHPDNVVLRTASIYGRGGRNYVSGVAAMVLRGEEPGLDPTRAVVPTSAASLARAVAALLGPLSHLSGVLHYQCAGPRTTWAAWGHALAALLGRPDAPIRDYNPPYVAPRPRVLLDTRRLRSEAYKFQVETWRDALAEYAQAEMGANR